MKTACFVFALMMNATAFSQIEMNRVDALMLIRDIEWQGLGAKSHFTLSNSEANCMTLTNYDRKVGFDCIISNDSSEVVLSNRDLNHIIDLTSRNLSESGVDINTDRANIDCFPGEKCILTPTLSMEEEIHLYCGMTTHTRYDGKSIRNSSERMTLSIDSIHCESEHSFDFAHRPKTTITAKIEAKEGINSQLGTHKFHLWMNVDGHLDQRTACRKINSLTNQDIAKVEKELIKTQWTSIRNSNIELIEQIKIDFIDKGLYFSGQETKKISRGSFCSEEKTKA